MYNLFILYSVLTVGYMIPVTDKNSVLLKLPKDITNGTYISITGEINNNDILSIALSGDKTDEKCRIVFNPMIQIIKVIAKTNNDTLVYNLDHNSKDPVSFSLNMIARTVVEETENDILDLYFEGDNAGPVLLPPCEFKFFRSIEYIRLKGILHLRSLLFVFDKAFD